HHKDFVALFGMRQLAKSLCVSWPSVNARGGQILCVPTLKRTLNQVISIINDFISKRCDKYLF
ncbi:hypothetical protein, partial [Aliarcobacter butzleri]|uniref:hypothetical protein n=1 Tax=Aliarcobacter butzleri TaxID=28197 RepID=UPI002B2500A0